MAMANFLALFLLMELIAGGYRDGANGLSMNYYVFSCPFAEAIVRNTVTSALKSDPTLAAGLVRMHFHDCWIQVIAFFFFLFSFLVYYLINYPYTSLTFMHNLYH
jgi:hypothetical protein